MSDDSPVDLDAARAARRELAQQQSIRLGGHVFALVDELPIETLELASAGRFMDALVGLLADPDAQAEALRGTRPTISEFELVLSLVFGVDLGEASASSPSSASTSRRSRPTS